MSGRRAAAAALVLLAVALATVGRTRSAASAVRAAAAAPASTPPGRLSALRGDRGCVSSPDFVSHARVHGCAAGHGFAEAGIVLASPDGRQLYVEGDGVGILRRDGSTGRLTQTGCLGGARCQRLPASTPGVQDEDHFGFAFSPDGRQIYASGPAIYDRDTRTGVVRLRAGPAGCFTDVEPAGSCTEVDPRAAGVGPAVSPDGRDVYLFSPGVVNAGHGAVAHYRRAPDGGLTPQPGVAPCAPLSAAGACATPPRPAQAVDGEDSVRGPLQTGPLGGTLSPDGRTLYVVVAGSVLLVFDRDPATGGLRQKPGAAGCLAAHLAGCARLRVPAVVNGDIGSVVVAPDGRTAYASGAGSILSLARDPGTGTLRQLPLAAGCVAAQRGCRGGVTGTVAIEELQLSPDGRNAYVIAGDDHEIGVFDRDPATGALRARPGRDGCVAGEDPRCTRSPLRAPSDLAFSPDGRELYVADPDVNGVVVLRRTGARAPVRSPSARAPAAGPASPATPVTTSDDVPVDAAAAARVATLIAHASFASAQQFAGPDPDKCVADWGAAPERVIEPLEQLYTAAFGSNQAIADDDVVQRTAQAIDDVAGVDGVPGAQATAAAFSAAGTRHLEEGRAAADPCAILRRWRRDGWATAKTPPALRVIERDAASPAQAPAITLLQAVIERHGGADAAAAIKAFWNLGYPRADDVDECDDAFVAFDPDGGCG